MNFTKARTPHAIVCDEWRKAAADLEDEILPDSQTTRDCVATSAVERRKIAKNYSAPR